jgi:hypothetical protein
MSGRFLLDTNVIITGHFLNPTPDERGASSPLCCGDWSHEKYEETKSTNLGGTQ